MQTGEEFRAWVKSYEYHKKKMQKNRMYFLCTIIVMILSYFIPLWLDAVPTEAQAAEWDWANQPEGPVHPGGIIIVIGFFVAMITGLGWWDHSSEMRK